MGIKDFINNVLKKDGRFKELEKEIRIRRMVEDRMKSSDERELEGFYKKEREKQIKKNLEEFRKKQSDETWHGKTILDSPNIFNGEPTMMKNGHSILDNGKGILNNKHKSFKIKSVKKVKKGGMFFKK